jgi:hypothetical protein
MQEDALQGEPGSGSRAKLLPAERTVLITRLDSRPTKADWALYDRELDAMLQGCGQIC